MAAKDSGIVVGGEPRIDFLPPEVQQKKSNKRTFRLLILVTILVAAVAALVFVGFASLTLASQIQLDAENDRSTMLLQEQREYADAAKTSGELEKTEDARIAASGSEILWAPFVRSMEATLPAGAGVSIVTVESLSSTESRIPPDGPLTPTYIAKVTIEAIFTSPEGITDWIDSLQTLPGVTGYGFDSAAYDDGVYVLRVALAVDDGALAARYFEAAPDADATEAAASTEGE